MRRPILGVYWTRGRITESPRRPVQGRDPRPTEHPADASGRHTAQAGTEGSEAEHEEAGLTSMPPDRVLEEIRALRADVQALPEKIARAIANERVLFLTRAMWWLVWGTLAYGGFQIVKKWLF